MGRRDRIMKQTLTLAILGVVLLVGAAGALQAATLEEGLAKFRAGDWEASVASLSELVAKDASNLSAWFWLGRSQLQAGRTDEAASTFERILADKPASVDSRYWLGVTYLSLGRSREAEAQFAQVLKADGRNQAARDGLAQAQKANLALTPVPVGLALARPLSGGGRVSLDPGPFGLDPGQVDLLSSNLYDYTFSDSPSDWTALSGLWAITNRWTCSPQWSWEGGYADDGIAALWNKREFKGDVTVEAYMAFKMGLGSTNSYKNPNDLNITIDGDGANPSSGYSFMVGANRNNETRIMKGTKVLATSTDLAHLLPVFEDGFPSTYEFHRRWWSIRARKTGNKLQLYVDEKLACEAVDPDPLPGGHVGLWTYDNGTIISRVKVYYDQEQAQRKAIPGMDQLRASVRKVADLPFTVSSPSHLSVQNDFESDLGTWTPRNDQDPVVVNAAVRLVSLPEPTSGPSTQGPVALGLAKGASGTGHCLTITNPVSGGTFATTAIPGSFDVEQLPMLCFDYCLPADGSCKLNFYLTCVGALYEIVFSGPRAGTPQAVQLGAIADVKADGQWHHATFDLLGALRLRLPAGATIRASDLWLGNLCEEDYLLAGFGGNTLGTTLMLDNFALLRPAGREVKLAATPRQGANIKGYSVALDDDPLGPAPDTVTAADGALSVSAKGPGVYYAHVKANLADGTWSPTANYLTMVDDMAPQVTPVSPKPGTVLGDAPLTLGLRDAGGVDPASIKVAVNGKAVPLDGDAASYDPASGTLTVDPRAALAPVSDGEAVALSVGPLKDWAGNVAAAPEVLNYRLAFAEDKTPPAAPVMTVGASGYLCNEDFEHSLGDISSYGGSGGADLSLDSTTAASGKSSLKVYNRLTGGRFGVYLQKRPFDAGKYRIVSFDYKVPPRLRSDFAVYVNGDWKAIKFKDTDNNLGYIGTVPQVVDDNQWHHAEFNLYDMLRKDDPSASSYIVRQFVMADWNWTANVKGQSYHLDNFQIIPVVSAQQGLPLAWKALDVSGTFGLSWTVDKNPTGDPGQEVKLTGTSGLAEGVGDIDGWLHTRARDGAGNWSEASHWRLLADGEAPTASPAYPREGAKVATSIVRLNLADQGPAGVDPMSIILRVAGKDYTMENRGLSYSSSRGSLVWNCEDVSPDPVVLSDKQPVAVQLVAAKDFAGNPVVSPPSLTWTMDWSQDHQGPEVTKLQSTTHPTFVTDTFETGLGEWRTFGQNGAKVEIDATTAGAGTHSVCLTQQKQGSPMAAYMTTSTFTLESYPVISFDYRLDPSVKLDLIVRMTNGNEYPICFTDNPSGAVGAIRNAVADGTWRHATVEVTQFLRQRQTQGTLEVAALYLTDRNQMDNPVGARAWFDNLVIGKVGTQPAQFRWRATDTTGVMGYSYCVDRSPSTEPPTTSKGPASSFRYTDAMTRGRYYFHVRAVDGAGNWGPTAHYALMHLQPD
jgi:hypothetical protein